MEGVVSDLQMLLQKKEARRQSIIKWRRKKLNTGCQPFVHLPLGRTSIDVPRKWKRKSVYGQHHAATSSSTTNVKNGKILLTEIPIVPDVLPKFTFCAYCDAIRFYSESRNFCCCDGRVRLVSNEIPELMQELLASGSQDAKHFRDHIRTYNNHFAFTSLGVCADIELSQRNKGIYTFRVQGQVYHFLNVLEPSHNSAKNLQLYFHDSDHEVNNRLASCDRLSGRIVRLCIKYLQRNSYSMFFRSLRSYPDLNEFKILLKTVPVQDQRVYNKLSVSQVAAVWVNGHENGENGERNIQVKTHANESRTIIFFYGCYDPLQYPLMFPFGEVGWHQHIPKRKISDVGQSSTLSFDEHIFFPARNISSGDDLLAMEASVLASPTQKGDFVSVREYYAYKLQIRRHDKSFLLQFGRLLQQYIVENYVKLESQRLSFYRNEQNDIRQEFYQGVVDAMSKGETSGKAIGRRIILPADFIGGPRNMRRRYIDAMTLVQRFGKPDIFLTMTCNPNWPEIKEHLSRYEESHNRPDLTARVFHAKMEMLKEEIFKKNIFGDVIAYTYVIELQKRGLPHVHFLLILHPHYKMYAPNQYDEIVCVEIPDENSQPHLYNMVKSHMIHGPCGYLNSDCVCMNADGVCKYGYPKSFSSCTTESQDAYPLYKRRKDGNVVRVRGLQLDNSWVVPYNPYLIAKFNCHINVEICSSIKATKYIYKYICKGCDKISFSLSDNTKVEITDEIDQFQSGRWISAPEGAWRLFRFSLGEIKPAVIHLPLHLENFQTMTFTCRSKLKNVIENPERKKTMLTEFFVHNKHDNFAKHLNLTYTEYPEHFVWKPNSKSWCARVGGDSVGRIFIAHPSEGARYYLRILLSKVRCPTSYDDLRTYNGKKVDSFREAALLRGYLLADDSQRLCLVEASTYHMPYQMRHLFATLLVYDPPNNPSDLWMEFELNMIEDFISFNQNNETSGKLLAIKQVATFLESMGKRLEEFKFLHDYEANIDVEDTSREIRAEKNIIVTEDDLRSINSLNNNQQFAFDAIMSKLNCPSGGAFFIDGPGGTGKTFLYRALLAKIRSEGHIALATASSGIAASLLPGGRTSHSRFKIPIDLTGSENCKVSKQSSLAMLIRSSKLIIWDEAPMSKRSTIECFDRLLKDIMDSNKVFGGKVVVLGGDFRQTLPVIRKGNKSDTISASLTNSYLWPLLSHFMLTENMRSLLDPEFTSFLLKIGNGEGSKDDESFVHIPKPMLIKIHDRLDPLSALTQYVFPDVYKICGSSSLQMNRATLTTKNTFVDEINDILIKEFPGENIEYYSIDKTVDENNQLQYKDLLHSITPTGMPPHKLTLKTNSPVILLRNINPTEGLCNGTRLFCTDLKKNVIRARIAFGDFFGKEVFINRIPLSPPSNEKYIVDFKRIQFPIKLCFAMTINKAQGQTLDFVGIYLKELVFSHGQLYVALSRAKQSRCIKVLNTNTCLRIGEEKTKNIVYRDILDRAYSCNV